MDVSAPALGLRRRLHAPPHHFAILSCHMPFAGADTRSDSGKPPLLRYTTALQNLSGTSASDLIFFHDLAMFNNSTRTGKRKRIIVEGGIESDSGEERDVDIGVTVDGRGRSRVSRTLHIQQTSSKRPQSLPAPPSNSLPSASPSTSQPLGEKIKRKQVCRVSLFLCA